MRQILSGRGAAGALDVVDFDVRDGELEIVCTGSATSVEATVEATGLARVPLPMVRKLESALGKFPKDGLRMRISMGELSIESFTLRHPEIEVRAHERRVADLPVNAAVIDVLAAAERFSADELEKSGLVGRVLAAQAEAGRIIDSVASSLAAFRVSREVVERLVREAVREHAKRQAAGT
ncbi:MAG: hypothetical protein M3P27_07700 [Acidobacteriota bacterium]|nr:hypothetical protein [Acidobacteriota bacterium]